MSFLHAASDGRLTDIVPIEDWVLRGPVSNPPVPAVHIPSAYPQPVSSRGASLSRSFTKNVRNHLIQIVLMLGIEIKRMGWCAG